MGWKQLKSTTKSENVNSFTVNYINSQGYSFGSFTEAFVLLGATVVGGFFVSFIAPIVAVALAIAGTSYGVAAIVQMFQKNADKNRIVAVLSDLYKYKGTVVETVSELWEYTSANGNATTWETRTNWYWR